MADDLSLSDSVIAALRTLLTETIFGAPAQEAYVVNPGEPGFVDTLKSLRAAQVSMPPGPGRKPIVSHANHVLYGFELILLAIGGDMQAFANADWTAAWRLERVTDAEWVELLRRLEAAAQRIRDEGPNFRPTDAVMLRGLLAIPAHTAYHLGAIRQILRDISV